MPVRNRRRNRRRPDDVRAWAWYFACGADFPGNLTAIGHDEKTVAPLAETVWREIGDDVIVYLDELNADYRMHRRPYFAERVFGPPSGRDHAR